MYIHIYDSMNFSSKSEDTRGHMVLFFTKYDLIAQEFLLVKYRDVSFSNLGAIYQQGFKYGGG